MPTQKTDISGNPYGITYAASGLTWKIAKKVDVTGTTAAIYNPFAIGTLINKGTLIGGSIGAYFDAVGVFGSFEIVNKSSGEISGQLGVLAVNYTGSVKVDNAGEISGSTAGVYASGNSTDVEVMNTGDISGGTFGVFIASGAAGAHGTQVDNHGTIESSQYGVYIASASTTPAKLVNHDDGTIKGGAVSILAVSPFTLKNDGKVVGLVAVAGYDAKIVNKGKIKGDVLLGDGNDVVKNKGDAKITGFLDTGYGNDKVVLGSKPEKLLFDSALDSMFNVDTIKKFDSGKDKFYLDEDFYSNITPGTLTNAQFHKGSSAADADDRIIYDKSTGALYYDPDGTGGIAQTQFAKLDHGTKVKASDFMIGEYSIVI